MRTTYICPDCHCEHDEPADGSFVLHARCIECAHTLAIVEIRVVATTRPFARGVAA